MFKNSSEAIERLCKLQAEVWHAHVVDSDSADCFCGGGGFWPKPGRRTQPGDYDGTFENGYRNDGKCIEFIEQAVREKLAALGKSE